MRHAWVVLPVLASSATACVRPPNVVTTRMNFECRAADGEYETWDAIIPETNDIVIEGSVRVVRAGRHENWDPAASVNIYDAARKRGGGIRLRLPPKRPNDMDVVKLSAGSWRTNPIGPVPRDHKPQHFSVRINRRPEIEMEMSGATGTLHVDGFKARYVVIGCSTGEFVYEDVTIETRP
jgi:hypothetical protein